MCHVRVKLSAFCHNLSMLLKSLLDRRVCWLILLRLSKALKVCGAGDYDHLPEAAFYMVGTIDEAIAKAEKLAAEAA